jgi:spore coat polysaccharide biosynthesis protein SpsF (cytidylyltransferase family)
MKNNIENNIKNKSINSTIYKHIMYNGEYINNNSCITYNTGLVSENNILMAKNKIDVESELKGQTVPNTYCADKMNAPFKYKPEFILNKCCDSDYKWNISTSYDFENVNMVENKKFPICKKCS